MNRRFIMTVVFCCVGLNSQICAVKADIGAIELEYKKPLALLQEDQLLHEHHVMMSVFSSFSDSYQAVIKQLNKDIISLKSASKKNKSDDTKRLYEELFQLRNFIKRHRTAYQAVHFHKQVHETYNHFFSMINNSQDVVDFILGQHLDQEVNIRTELSKFLKELSKSSSKVSKFEDILHADYVDLKLNNYVLKIEFIRLRNSILFDKRYKK